MEIKLSNGVETLKPFLDQFNIYKKRAFSRLEELDIPSKKSEEYRYFGVEKILSKSYKFDSKNSYEREIKDSDKIVIEDGVVIEICDEVDIGCSSTLSLEMEHFDPIYYLSHSISGDVISLRFKKSSNITIEHRFTKPDSLLTYRVALYIDSNISVKISETFIGDDAKNSLF